MRKIIFATHHQMASGLKDTFNYIAPNVAKIITVDAYMDNTPVDVQIKALLDDLDTQDELIIFTDLLGGSVNQAFVKYLTQPHIHLITGINLPVILTILLALPKENYLSPTTIRNALTDARTQLIYVNDYLTAQIQDGDDE
ncbi:PTS sugar transporter subunit IIA [Liquorilactobacillus capillatus]|uniref:PTS family mannose fructose sorbose porter component IIA n=1 Tax=Liquorilactobacillus capillatus DSM 19910 TaxID=1423731 RepID=A0A0R1MDR7_9LACO|nr:PTS sugar transporter subunit IIA [Liquorilactobacillus capillatus]KRL02443.1 PTS family mannose fructose sorbose porter component IIA [Liquorilactobacillus capillatus DSM 19910]